MCVNMPGKFSRCFNMPVIFLFTLVCVWSACVHVRVGSLWFSSPSIPPFLPLSFTPHTSHASLIAVSSLLLILLLHGEILMVLTVKVVMGKSYIPFRSNGIMAGQFCFLVDKIPGFSTYRGWKISYLCTRHLGVGRLFIFSQGWPLEKETIWNMTLCVFMCVLC